jgi:hypothetical protein
LLIERALQIDNQQSTISNRKDCHDFCGKNPQQRRSVWQQAPAARARALAAAVHPVVEGYGAAGVPGLSPGVRPDGRERRSGRLGALRVRAIAHMPLGIFLADPVHDRRIGFGDFAGQPVWRKCRANSGISSDA